uniref:LLM class flavin-dependent oxidoreductase n=1 Tax=Corynebacterium casei TaxID=160386 RepID=UPI0013570DBC|nr:LLM class flavin-dependent oxidoreductase [Corynebacterium casei]
MSISIFGNEREVKPNFPDELASFIKAVDFSAIHTVWFPERHGTEQPSHHAMPLANIAFSASVNRQVHFGAGSLIPSMHQQHALLDQLEQAKILTSNRLRVALGAGWDEEEFNRYGTNFSSRYEYTNAFADALRTDPQFQSSENLLTTISSSKERWVEAGKNGLGVYCGAFGKSFSSLRELILSYRIALINSPHRKDSGWVSCMTHFRAAQSDTQAQNEYANSIEGYLTRHSSTSGLSSENRKKMIDQSILRMENEMGLIGSPSRVAERLEKYERIGVDELVVLFDYTGSLKNESEQLEILEKVVRGE